MLKLFQKKKCNCCGKKTNKCINYAGYYICSENCMIDFFKNITIEELIKLDMKDREINYVFYRWIYGVNENDSKSN